MTPSSVLAHDGTEQSIKEWALDYGITPAVIIARLERGLSVEDAITTPMVVAPGQKLVKKHVIRKIEQESLWTPPPEKKVEKTYRFDGKDMSLREWAALLGIPADTLYARLRADWGVERAFTEPFRKRRARNSKGITFDGRTMNVSAWAIEVGISVVTLHLRLRSGWTIERALTEPAMNATERVAHRAAQAPFRNSDATGGYQPTSAEASGTGQGSDARDLHGESSDHHA